MNKIIYLIAFFCLVASCTESARKPNSKPKPTQSSTLKKGLVLHSSFDSDAKDASANKLHGTLHGAYVINEGPVGGGSMFFDGLDDYISYPASADYFIGDYAMSIWCNWGDVKEWTRILDFNQKKPTTGKAVTWLLGRRDQGKFNMWLTQWAVHDKKAVENILDFEKYTPSDAYLNYEVEPDKWAHYVVSYDANQDSLNTQINVDGKEVPLKGAVTLYVNGKEIYTTNYCLEPQAFKTTKNYLGRSAFKEDPFFEGKMDDFRIYNRPLSPSEVGELYNLGDFD